MSQPLTPPPPFRLISGTLETHPSVEASNAGGGLTITAGHPLTARAASRTLSGWIIRWDTPGRTSAGLLAVAPDALSWPDDLGRVKLTYEHDRDRVRGHLVALDVLPDGIRGTFKVSDGPDGDAALQEAQDRTRDAFSFDIVDAQIDGDRIVSGEVIAVGQVGIPAFADMRIDAIAASHKPHHNNTEGTPTMTEEQRKRLAALRGQDTLNQAEAQELADLAVLEAAPAQETPQESTSQAQAPQADAPAQVAASLSSVAPGVPAPRAQAIRSRESALDRFLAAVTHSYATQNPSIAIQAALADVVESDARGITAPPAWSGELWSGLQYEPEFTPLLGSGPLTAMEGKGWRFTERPEMDDYAGDKAEIPTSTISVAAQPWTAQRMAVGNDFDRAFYDFPNQYGDVLRGYVEAVRESWAERLDVKVRTWILANATPVTVAAQPTLLKAAAKAVRALKSRRVGRATFVVANDADFETLLDYTQADVPGFMELYGIDPSAMISDPSVPAGTVIAGVKNAAKVLTLPGSPIRAEAQHLSHGGIDQAFFGYWAIEEHHPEGIASVEFEAPAEA